MPFRCGQHRAFIYERGGQVALGEVTPLMQVRWSRKRDDISDAFALVAANECCELLGSLRTILHELHIMRNGVIVWQGPITRLEYEFDQVSIYAEDVLWQAKRMVLLQGYDQTFPNIWNAVDRMHWLVWDNCYALDGDPWRMNGHLHPVHGSTDPLTSRSINPYQFTVWEDFDRYAENSGTDYTVMNRDIYYWDTHYAWKILPDLDDRYMSQFPRIVEYGNEAYTRAFVTDGNGHVGSYTENDPAYNAYGNVDKLISNTDNANIREPSAEDLAQWSDTARRNVTSELPPIVDIAIPFNTTLLPGSPWSMEDLFPGAWFRCTVTHVCRQHSEFQRLDNIQVSEVAPEGETVNFTADAAPTTMVLP